MNSTPKEIASLDWSKQDCVLADEIGLAPVRIHYWRKKLGKPRPALYWKHRLDHRPNKMKKRYGHLDFENKRDADLARECGITRERIRQVRNYFGRARIVK